MSEEHVYELHILLLYGSYISPVQIDYMWEDLRKEFHAMDPYKTGFVNKDEFREVLSELCVNLSEYELDLVCVKFNINSDDRYTITKYITNLFHQLCNLRSPLPVSVKK